MIKLSKHFVRSEFQCRCGCGFDTVDAVLINILEDVREHFNKPVHITSGCRCLEHNEREGGSSKSQHLLGRAADIIVADTEPDDVARYLEITLGGCGIGRYPTFTHVDSRNVAARWVD
jgi:uncharacterized protein YcbK (DUF882 family)